MAADSVETHDDARRGLTFLAFAYLAVFTVLIVGATAIVLFGKPTEPTLHVAIAPPLPGPPAARNAGRPSATPSLPETPPRAPMLQPIYAGSALIADPNLLEMTENGPLPRISDAGVPPMRAYAGAFADTGKPRIAIIVNGLGISAKATAAAIDKLPAQVTLAFAPYAGDVQHWVIVARQKGHEVLLEVPMEPFDFPDSDPGPHTLRSGVGEDANTERLAWALTRFTGYTGVTNLLGGRLLSDADSLEPVMAYLARRGLLFFDNGTATHSAAPDVAARAGVAFAQANSEIDSIQTAMEIDHALSELEATARAQGVAAGSGFIYPVTVDRVAQWAQGLGGRGFVLVPASAIVRQKQ